jgi:hypothetical protein
LLSQIVHLVVNAHKEVNWNLIAPLNISLFAWRLIKNWLQDIVWLLQIRKCMLVVESFNHLLLGCDFSQSLCSKIRIRLGIHDPLENVVNDHPLQICNSLVFGKDV